MHAPPHYKIHHKMKKKRERPFFVCAPLKNNVNHFINLAWMSKYVGGLHSYIYIYVCTKWWMFVKNIIKNEGHKGLCKIKKVKEKMKV